MKQENDYIDQLFKDHFEDFHQSPSEEVWKGIVKTGAMANGRRFAIPKAWRMGLMVFLTGALGILLLSGTDAPGESPFALEEVLLSSEGELNTLAEGVSAPNSFNPELTGFTSYDGGTSQNTPNQVEVAQTGVSSFFGQALAGEKTSSQPSKDVSSVVDESVKNIYHLSDLLSLKHLKWEGLGNGQAVHEMSLEQRRGLNRELLGKTTYFRESGGQWFVSGGFIMDGSIDGDRSFSDGLAFGAGKYLTPNSFFEVGLRGVWSEGFSMRATYTQLLLPGKVRPFVQVGLAWDYDLDMRVGVGLLYEPSQTAKWKFFFSANYERSSRLFDGSLGENTIFEIGAQMRLSGTERVLSDNNWMNSIPHYTVPDGLYLEGTANFALFDQTKVTRGSVYLAKNLNRRLYSRAGLRMGRGQFTIPAHLQYNVLVRKKLQFGAFAGPSLRVDKLSLGLDFGLAAYYEVLPGWSLYVAPVILENSDYHQRVFETGIRYYLPGKR